MKMPYEYDNGKLYGELMEEIASVQNVANAAKGKMPDHLHTRLEKSGKKMQRTMKRILQDEDHPDLEDLADMEDMYESRTHVNLEVGRI